MKKKTKIILATSIGIVLVIGSLVTRLVLSSTLANGTSSNAANGASSSGAIVIEWNKELLHIVQTPGAQSATVHPTRSYAILHAAIYDAVVSITRDASPYLFSVNAPSTARPDAAAAQAGHDTLVALYPTRKVALDQQLSGELATIPDGARKQQGIQIGQAVAARLIAMRASDRSTATLHPIARATSAVTPSSADRTISFYEADCHYQLWRPVTAIRLANKLGNPAIVANPAWTPLAVAALDPPHPAAHDVISGDGATVLAAF